MKRSIAFFILIPCFGFACDRVSMERSPEAVVSYGVPSQHSNSVPTDEKAKSKVEATQGWFSSSAIETKTRRDY